MRLPIMNLWETLTEKQKSGARRIQPTKALIVYLVGGLNEEET